MAKYLSNKFKTLKVGIDSFSENTTSLNVTGDVKIGTGITISSTAGVITAISFSKYGGTSGQFLMADGSTTSSTFLTTESDTLDTVLGRGNSSTKNLSVGIITATSFSGTISTATVATKVNITNHTNTSEENHIVFIENEQGAGSRGLESDSTLTYNPSTGKLTSTQLGGTLQTAAQPNITSVGTLSTLNVSGTVSIGGTLTYEDVTNIDSVGLVTARSGIHVGPTAAGVATVTTDGNASFIGVVTATNFTGNLTGNATGISSYTAEWILGADGINNYTFTGPGLTGAENDPTIYLMRGEKYKFTNNMGAHPFRIQSTANGSTGTIYNDGITNNDVSNGTLIWDVQFDAPSTLYYQCTAHGNMGGVIRIISHATSTLNELSDDTTPQLGGNLDVNGKNITGTGNVNLTGIVTATSFVGDGSGLSGAGIGTNGSVNTTGIITATSFSGSGANLTGIDTDLVSDTSPQLGGNLDVNGKHITGTGNVNLTGIVTATSFDGSLASGDVATSANSIILGRVSGGAGSVEELTPGQIRTLLNVADGATAGSGIANIVEDGTPELGGYLDLNSKGIFGVGVITATSFVGSGASLTALPALTNSKSVVNPGYPQNQTFTVILAARYNLYWDHYSVDSGSTSRDGNISGADIDININVGDTLILDLATEATLNNAAGGTYIKTAPGTGTANQVGVSPDTNPLATNNGSSSTNITWSPTVAGTYYYQNGNRVNMRGQIIVSPQASPPASRFISDINFNSEGRVVGVVTFNGINAATKSSRGIVQIHNDPNLTVQSGIVSVSQSLNLTGIVTAASFSGSGVGLTSLNAANLTGQLPVINAANLTNLSSSQLTGALPAISGAALTGIQYTGIATFNGQLFLNGMSKETINIVANRLSAATDIDLEDGLVHYFSTSETTDATPNIRFNSSTTLNSKLSVGDSVTVTIISVTDNTNDSYEQLQIDGSAVTEQWIGGAPPGGGSSGYDVYTYQIIKTADATYLVFANKVNFT